MKRVLGLLLALLAWAPAFSTASAEEYIKSYHSDITVGKDGTLTVTETITVNAEGDDIRRGIFRDFPLYRKDGDGRTIKVGFELLSVERDGEPEAFHTEGVSGGIRIYAGSADVWLEPGEYTYAFTYETTRQILYYDDQDELYWNVNGNGWMFPAREVTATVHLPGGAEPTETDVFTGHAGDTGKDAWAELSDDGVEFGTTRPLGGYEGLTILVGMPKGVVDTPSDGQRWWWFLVDNAGTIIGAGGLGLVFLYYLRSWLAVGRDPEAGVMVPRWDAPDGISPALVNYIDNTGFSGAGWTALSASAIDLAVKGYVELDDLDKSIVIRRTDKPVEGKLPAGQANLLSSVGGPGSSLTIDRANGERVKRVGETFRSAIEKEHRGRFYKDNTGYIVGGVVLSLASLAALLLFGGVDADLTPVLFVVGILSVVVGSIVPMVGRGLRRGAALFTRILSIIVVAVVGFVSVSIASTVLLVVATDIADSGQLPVLVAFGGILLVNVLFFFLMGAPTPLGRKMMDGIEGLRTYLTLAEKDRMNMQGAPRMSPRHFETLLPYAVALGVEKPWTRAFEAWLASAAAGAAAASYQPAWYHGRSVGGFSDRIGGFSSSMASTIASTIPQPKSSSGGGGGFSGGGGGGGGGGGW